MTKVCGLYTAMITPFKDNAVDEEGFVQNLKRQVDAGIDGVVILATTGEAPTLSEEEQEVIIRLAVEHGGEDLHIMVGTGGNSTQSTIQKTLIAKALGAHGALVVAPYYNKPTQGGLYQHFSAICEACDFPVMVYNNPGRCGINIEPLTMRQIAELPHVIGVKDTTTDVDRMSDMLHVVCEDYPDFSVMSGDDSATFSLMTLGGDGVISVLSNLLPRPMIELVRALESGKTDKAREVHFSLLPLFKAMAFETNPMPIKTAMALCGQPAGECRLPLTGMSDAHKESLMRLLTDSALLPAGARQ